MTETTHNTLPNNTEARRLVAEGDRAAIIEALGNLIDYRLAHWDTIKAASLRRLDASIRTLNASL